MMHGTMKIKLKNNSVHIYEDNQIFQTCNTFLHTWMEAQYSAWQECYLRRQRQEILMCVFWMFISVFVMMG